MNLIRTTFLNAIAVSIKMATLLGINKLLAVYVGPVGYAVVGQFQSAVQIITTFASGAINTGVTKYTAEYYDDESKQIGLWRTSGTIAIVGSVLTAFCILFSREFLSIYFLNDINYSIVFVFFSLSLVLFVSNSLLLAILNGKKEIFSYVIANIVGSLSSLLFTSVLAVNFGIVGALIALSTYQSFAFFATLYIVIKKPWFKLKYLFGQVKRQYATNLLKYTAMALAGALCVPVSHILIRDFLGNSLSWNSAGCWEAMWRLSSAYLMLITTTLSVYYLPKLSETKDREEIVTELKKVYKVVFPAVILLSGSIYFLRDFLVETLFSVEFQMMKELFLWQIIGDVIKVASWILGYILTAKAHWKMFIATEVAFSIISVLLVHFFVSNLGFYGASVAHASTYFLHFLFMLFVLKRVSILK